MRDVTDETFEGQVIGAGGPVVVEFWAPWCRPCKAVETVLAELAARAAGVEFVRLDVDESPRTAHRFGVLSIPTVILFAGGQPQRTILGVRSRRQFEQSFDGYL